MCNVPTYAKVVALHVTLSIIDVVLSLYTSNWGFSLFSKQQNWGLGQSLSGTLPEM